jgi:HlyD family secretion protein
MDRMIVRLDRPWWKDWRFIAAAAFALIGILVWRALPASGSSDIDADQITIGKIELTGFDDYLPVRATVAPAVTTLVGVIAGGQVELVLVQDGVLVVTGQPLAVLSNPDLQLEVLTREAQIASQLGGVAGENLGIARTRIDRSTQVAQAEYDLIKAKRDLAVQQQLRDRGFVSDAGVASYSEEVAYQEKRLAQLGSGAAAERSITANQSARLNDTRIRLEKNMGALRSSLDALTVRAPATGRLTNFSLQPGQSLDAGAPAGQVDTEGQWKLVANVDEYYLGRIDAGQRASMGEVKLTISKIIPTVTNGTFRIELTFDGKAPKDLNRGQSVDLRIILGATAPAIVAPMGGWLQSDGGSSVFVLDKDGSRSRRRLVKIGRRNPSQVEILSGLKPGDRIITSDTSSIKSDTLNHR